MIEQTLKTTKENFEKALAFLKGDLNTLRTGRANSALVEKIRVSYYGAPTPLIQLASINVPEPRSIVIQPFDINSIKEIEKALNDSKLGLNPMNDGRLIRLNLPALTEERRKELVVILKQKLEEGRIAVRNHREEAWKLVKKAEAAGEISEDEKYQAQEKLNKLVTECNEKIEQIGRKKEEEITSV